MRPMTLEMADLVGDCNGMGQGDTASILAARPFISVQFKLWDAYHPNVKKGSCVDDCNIRGNIKDIQKAYRDMVRF